MDPLELESLYSAHLAELERSYGQALSALGWDGVVIHSGRPVKRSEADDQDWPLRPTPHWQHWLPLVEADAALIVRPGRRPKVVRTAAATFWEKPLAQEQPAKAFAQSRAVSGAQARAEIGPGRIAFVGEQRGPWSSWVDDGARVNPADLVGALDALRAIKTPYEVACIAEANRRAAAGHEALRTAFRESELSELDLHLSYLRATEQDDPETPYKNIVALGASAATLHHIAYGRRPVRHEGQSLLVDAGATCRGYGSDVTRTWVKGGGAAEAFGHLVARVDAMQLGLCEATRAGVPYEELHDLSHRRTAAILREVGLIRASSDEAVDTGITRAFYPHGLGHSLGVQTHDVGCALRKPRAENHTLRNTSDVAPGQVLTIEPGIYFITELLDALRSRPEGGLVVWSEVAALAPFGGVRVEDDVVIESTGAPRNLTREVLPDAAGAP